MLQQQASDYRSASMQCTGLCWIFWHDIPSGGYNTGWVSLVCCQGKHSLTGFGGTQWPHRNSSQALCLNGCVVDCLLCSTGAKGASNSLLQAGCVVPSTGQAGTGSGVLWAFLWAGKIT